MSKFALSAPMVVVLALWAMSDADILLRTPLDYMPIREKAKGAPPSASVPKKN